MNDLSFDDKLASLLRFINTNKGVDCLSDNQCVVNFANNNVKGFDPEEGFRYLHRLAYGFNAIQIEMLCTDGKEKHAVSISEKFPVIYQYFVQEPFSEYIANKHRVTFVKSLHRLLEDFCSQGTNTVTITTREGLDMELAIDYLTNLGVINSLSSESVTGSRYSFDQIRGRDYLKKISSELQDKLVYWLSYDKSKNLLLLNDCIVINSFLKNSQLVESFEYLWDRKGNLTTQENFKKGLKHDKSENIPTILEKCGFTKSLKEIFCPTLSNKDGVILKDKAYESDLGKIHLKHGYLTFKQKQSEVA